MAGNHRALEIERTDSENKEVSKPYSFWKDTAMARRLNTWGVLTLLYDTAIELICSSNTANEFVTNTIPYYISAGIYFIPSTIPFLPKIFTCCKKKPDKEEDAIGPADIEQQLDFIAERSKKVRYIIDESDSLQRDSKLVKYQILRQNRDLMLNVFREFVKGSHEYHRLENLEEMNMFVNLIYLSFRGLRGALIVFRVHDLASQETNSLIDTIADHTYNVLSVLYTFALLFHLHKHKKAKSRKKISDAPVTLFSDKKTQLIKMLTDGLDEPLMEGRSVDSAVL